jgi:hypothetical protein
MSKASMRVLLTILMYSGVGIFLYPYVSGVASGAMLLLIGGAAMTVGCGLCRCFLTEGDCSDRHMSKPAP